MREKKRDPLSTYAYARPRLGCLPASSRWSLPIILRGWHTPPFHRIGNWGTKRSRNKPSVTQLVRWELDDAFLTPQPELPPLHSMTLITTTLQKLRSRCLGEQHSPGTQKVCFRPAPSRPHSAEFYTQGLALMKSLGTFALCSWVWTPPTRGSGRGQGGSNWESTDPHSRIEALWPEVIWKIVQNGKGILEVSETS